MSTNSSTIVVTTALALAQCLASVPALSKSSLDGPNAAELERLLAVPAEKQAVPYSHRQMPRIPVNAFDRYLVWHEISLDTTAIDHTPVEPTSGEDRRRFGEQLGPHKSSYAMAIIHIAMFEAINAITRKYESYVGLAPVHPHVSMDRAIAQAAHDTLVALYPFQAERIDALLAEDIAAIHGSGRAIGDGAELGARAARAILEKREGDHSELPEPRVGVDYFPGSAPGDWQPDPISKLGVALGGNWPQVTPFVLESAHQFRPVPPPALTDAAYTGAYDEVQRLGGDPANGTSTSRTQEQTFTAILWGYDGTPSLCAPPRLYNQIARTIALKKGLHRVDDLARFLALVNVAMVDAGIAAWEAKYYYRHWRPVTGIRAGDTDSNPSTHQDPGWYPLGAPATNTQGGRTLRRRSRPIRPAMRPLGVRCFKSCASSGPTARSSRSCPTSSMARTWTFSETHAPFTPCPTAPSARPSWPTPRAAYITAFTGTTTRIPAFCSATRSATTFMTTSSCRRRSTASKAARRSGT